MATFLGLDLAVWWFLVVGAVFTGYAVLDGFDLGAGAVHLLLRKEESRRIALNAIGPVWDGNEVWLVIGGGTLFAGFPVVYGTVFSAFYVPFMLFLVALIFRAISIEFRSKEPMPWWRTLWDWSYSVASVVIALSLGVVLGNLIQGLPIGADREFHGSWLTFLNPYALLVGATTAALFAQHGAVYLLLKTENRIFARLTLIVRQTLRVFVALYLVLSVATLWHVPHMLTVFRAQPWLFAVPLLTLGLVLSIGQLIRRRRYFAAFLCSGSIAALLLLMVAAGLFPVLVRSTLNPAWNLTIYNSASSAKSLGIMLTIAAIGIPLVATYTGFVFWVFRGKVRLDEASY
ncbi:cytochrome d ubiquinol oxidase subunit II [Hymenobacter jeollabukensis]|uniref:Cytochrome d ubiquinol oxidase subunit II n=1 Tax=Hymenobacter jeollabukensis TaxID=2025313 RepID=A0A5R8WHH4_9BACT|nr:cytochrome d ubiquinol oxidase subunit II [Hymenobacter jeollabukensis]TLM87825.1 cytochrome d ubiquinol oxidase subunit II [Hymenobacter jeollabukensis]